MPARTATSSSFKAILRILGVLLVMFSTTMLPPVLVGLWYGETVDAFLQSFIATLVLGACVWIPTRREKAELRHRDGFVVVVLFWIVFCLLSALPFMLTEHVKMSFTASVFEATSGLTTTGATILNDLDSLPKSINYYRAQLCFFGGMGIIVLAVALLPMLGIGGMELYRAETPGPMKDDKLTPRITETAKRLWYVYLALNVACSLSFWMAGMTPFDAIAHSFSTMALGGFSTHTNSLGYYNSPAVEVVGGVFSILAGVNFALFFLSWRRRSVWPIFRDPEFRFYLGFIFFSIFITVFWLYHSGTFHFWDALVHGFFQAASIVTDNGLTAGNYPNWPMHIALFLVMGSFFGGCAGSACGGIKAIRFLLLFRQSLREVNQLMHPRGQFAVKVGNRAISDNVMRAVWAFYFFYIFSFCAFSLALTFTGVDLITAFGSVAACLNNMGVGLGETAGNFGTLNHEATWLLIVSMLVGRLEVFPLLVLVLRYWRE